jgi:predicted flap endonuclease-1-like 5' DNA nuclease
VTLLNDYVGLIAIAAILLLVLLFFLLRPRQRVKLTDKVPVRPHMQDAQALDRRISPPTPGVFVTDGQKVAAGPKDATHPGAPDDLLLLKGVGPKLADLLKQHGLTRFDQIAGLGQSQIQTLDENLGAFRGRLVRDRIVEQADYLARGDRDGFEQKFGKL